MTAAVFTFVRQPASPATTSTEATSAARVGSFTAPESHVRAVRLRAGCVACDGVQRDELVDYCLTKPGAYLDTPWADDVVVKVAGKIFCFLERRPIRSVSPSRPPARASPSGGTDFPDMSGRRAT